ncbi:hypothetical protein Bca101_059805 [Brassica carinata]
MPPFSPSFEGRFNSDLVSIGYEFLEQRRNVFFSAVGFSRLQRTFSPLFSHGFNSLDRLWITVLRFS